MPKQIHNIQAFHGGLSNNSDPRDIDNTEMSTATDVMVDEVGKIRTMGGNTAHVSGTSTAIQIEPGYGLFKWSHDRLYGHLGEHLDNTGDFSSLWAGGNGWTLDSTDATYAHHASPADLIQTAANRAEVGLNSKEYIFTYTISGFSETITLFEILGGAGQFANATTALEQSNGTHSVTFTSRSDAEDNPFTINVTSGASGAFNIDNVSLRLYDVAETGDDYLVLADDESSDPAIYMYSKNEDTWSNVKSQVITLGSTSNPKPSFYSIDGALRVSDGNFGSENLNQWYGYIDRTLFEELEPSYTINQWFNAPQKIEKPNSCFYDDNIEFGDVYGDTVTTAGGDSASSVSQSSFSGQDEIITVAVTTRSFIASPFETMDVNLVVRVGTYSDGAFVTYQDITMLNGWYMAGTLYNVGFAYFDAADTTVADDWGGDAAADTFRAEIITSTNIAQSGIIQMITYEEGTPPSDLSASLANNNAFVEFDWETDTGASGWCTAVANSGKWEIGFSFIYDEEQESQITTATDVSGGAATLTVPGTDATTAPNIRLFFADWNNVESPWNKRITGCNMYMRDVAQTSTQSWFLQVSVDFIKGKALVATSQKEFDAIYYAESNQPYYYFQIGSTTGVADECEMLEPSLTTTYEVKSGLDAIEKSVISQYRSAVVVGRRVYVGGLMVENEDSSKDIMADAMIKTPVNKFDVFPLSRMIEASVRDGDEIIKLEEYADRILQFKKNKVHIINVSQEIEFLEDTFIHKGISHPAAACKTDFGVAWVNRLGCYLYDGQKVTNLLEKGGRQIIKESEWDIFTTDNSMIGYLPKKRQLIVARDSRNTFTLTGSIDPTGTNTAVPGTGTKFLTELSVGDSILVSTETRVIDSITNDTTATVSAAWGSDLANDTSPECLPSGDIFLYDMVTQSWVKGDSALTDGVLKTNFVTDWNGDLVYVHTTGTVLKWDDSSAASTTFEMITKDIDLGQPGQRKKLHKVYVTYKGATATNVDVYFDVDGGTSLNKTFADGTNFSSNELAASASWAVAELKPTTSAQANNIKSFRLKFVAESGQVVPSDFEINDISAVYRLKNVK